MPTPDPSLASWTRTVPERGDASHYSLADERDDREDRARWPYIAAPSVGTVWKWRLAAWRIELARWLRGEGS